MSMHEKEEIVPGTEAENEEMITNPDEQITDEMSDAEEPENVTDENTEENTDEEQSEEETEVEEAESEEESEEEETEEESEEAEEEDEEEPEEEPLQPKKPRSFGKIWLLQMADVLNILLILGAVALFVFGGMTEGGLLCFVWLLRTVLGSMRFKKLEKQLAKEGLDASSLYEKTEADKKLYKGVYIATACIIFVVGALTGLSLYFRGLDYSVISACVGFLVLVCPTEILLFQKLGRAEGKRILAEGGSISCPGARAIREAEYVVVRESDVVSDKLNFAKIDTYYKAFGTKDSFIGRDKPVFRTILEMIVLASEIKTDANGLYKGSGVELALVNMAAEQGVYKEALDEKFKRSFVMRSDNAVTFGVKLPEGVRMVSKGQTATILSMCDRVLGDGEVHPISEEIIKEITDRAEAYRKEGAHVCAISFSDYQKKPKKDTTDKMFLGLLVSYYMPNSAGIAMIKKYENAGLKPLLFSHADNEKTAAMLKLYKKDSVCIIKEEATDENLEDTTAYCGMTPEKEQAVLEVYRKAGKDVLVFVQKKENKHLCQSTDASVLVGKRSCIDGCGGTLRYKSDIFDLRKNLSAYLYAEKKTVTFLLIVKAFLLAFGLLWSGISFACPMQFYQMLFLSLFVPVCATHILYAPYRKEKGKAPRKKGLVVTLYTILAFLVLALSYAFGRYTVPALSADSAKVFASAMSFLVAGGILLLLAIQSISHKILLSFSFITSKQAWLCLIIGAVLTVAMFMVPALRALVAIPALPYLKGMWIGIFLLVFAVASDLIKYILKEKE